MENNFGIKAMYSPVLAIKTEKKTIKRPLENDIKRF